MQVSAGAHVPSFPHPARRHGARMVTLPLSLNSHSFPFDFSFFFFLSFPNSSFPNPPINFISFSPFFSFFFPDFSWFFLMVCHFPMRAGTTRPLATNPPPVPLPVRVMLPSHCSRSPGTVITPLMTWWWSSATPSSLTSSSGEHTTIHTWLIL